MIMSIVWAKALIREAEGFSASEYMCPSGYPSIGYGRNLKFYPLTDKDKSKMSKNKLNEWVVSRNLADDWLEDEVQRIYEKIKDSDFFVGIGYERQAVVIDMIYNLGQKSFNEFKKFKQALIEKDFEKASFEIEHGSDDNGKSKYWNQTGLRAKRNAQIIKTGTDTWDLYDDCERI